MEYPQVTIITPTTHDREPFNKRIADIVAQQDYKGSIEHLIDYNDGLIGQKLNRLCENAKGDIILRGDSDDFYSPDYVSKSVQFLLDSGADCTGLSNAFFYKPATNQMWRYDYPLGQQFVLGATLVFHKSTWERSPFRDDMRNKHGGLIREDAYFCAMAGNLKPHEHINTFCAIRHGKNTISDIILKDACFTEINPSFARIILGNNYNKFKN